MLTQNQVTLTILVGIVTLVLLVIVVLIASLLYKKAQRAEVPAEASKPAVDKPVQPPIKPVPRYYFGDMVSVSDDGKTMHTELLPRGQRYIQEMTQVNECLVAIDTLLMFPIKTVANLVGTGHVVLAEEQSALHLLMQGLVGRTQQIVAEPKESK